MKKAFFIALVLRFALLFFYVRNNPGTAAPLANYDYGMLAYNIHEHEPYGLGFTFTPLIAQPLIQPYYPPIYPLALSLMTQHRWIPMLFDTIVSVISLLILWAYLKAKVGETLASCMGLLLGLHWSSIYQPTTNRADTLLTLFVTLAMIWTIRCVE